MQYYIKGGKLADNVFKRVDFILIVVELQPVYVFLNIGSTTVVGIGWMLSKLYILT